MARRFNKFGLRRDLNFADIPNKESALNNILNGLVDVQGESFISEDLDAIQNISNTSISNKDFRNITGAALRVTNDNGILEVYKPVVKIKNRIDIAKFTIGEPTFFGGNGLTNKYFDVSQINSTATNVGDIFTGNPTFQEVFWEHGVYSFQSKIRNEYNDVYGGVQWDGYFKPRITGVHTFVIRSRGFFTFEFDDGSGNFTLATRKSQYEYTFQVQPAAVGATTLTLSNPEAVKNLLRGDVLIHPSITQFADPDIEGSNRIAITITDINRTTGVITISSALESAITVATNFTFRFRIGVDDNDMVYNTDSIEKYKLYKIRIRFWIPNIPQIDPRSLKTFEMWMNEPNFGDLNLNYKYLYSEDYNINPQPDSPEFGDFYKFYINRLNPYGGIVGGTVYNDYQSIISKSPVNITYQPKTSLSAVTKQTKTVNTTINKNIIPMTITDNIEVGNYVFGNNIPVGTRVSDISINNAIFLSQNATATASGVSVVFIDHRGLIGFDTTTTYTSGGYMLTNVDAALVTNLEIGDIIVNSHTPQYTMITRISGTTLTVSNAFTADGTNVRTLFYRSKGLYNKSLAAYCVGVVSAPTAAQSNAGSSTLTLAYTTGIVTGMVVQFGSRIQSATTVTAINQTTKVVTLSKTLTDEIPFGQLITFAPAGTTDNKEICFPPIDTSPPFTATSDGLQTTAGRPAVEIRPITGTGELKFVGLSANNVPVNSTTPAATYSKTLVITDATGITYRILGTL